MKTVYMIPQQVLVKAGEKQRKKNMSFHRDINSNTSLQGTLNVILLYIWLGLWFLTEVCEQTEDWYHHIDQLGCEKRNTHLHTVHHGFVGVFVPIAV